MDVVAVDAHELGQCQGGGKLGKLGRLNPDGAEHEPGVGALDAVGVEDGGEDQQQEGHVYGVGERLVIAVVEQQQDDANDDARGNPDNLHARTGGERQQVGVAVVVAGTADAHPPGCQQQQVDDDGHPVERA